MTHEQRARACIDSMLAKLRANEPATAVCDGCRERFPLIDGNVAYVPDDEYWTGPDLECCSEECLHVAMERAGEGRR